MRTRRRGPPGRRSAEQGAGRRQLSAETSGSSCQRMLEGHVDADGVSEIVRRAGSPPDPTANLDADSSATRNAVSAEPSWTRTSTGVRVEPPSGPTEWTQS